MVLLLQGGFQLFSAETNSKISESVHSVTFRKRYVKNRPMHIHYLNHEFGILDSPFEEQLCLAIIISPMANDFWGGRRLFSSSGSLPHLICWGPIRFTTSTLRIIVVSFISHEPRHSITTFALVLTLHHREIITPTNTHGLSCNIDFVYLFLQSSTLDLFLTETFIKRSPFRYTIHSFFLAEAGVFAFVHHSVPTCRLLNFKLFLSRLSTNVFETYFLRPLLLYCLSLTQHW